MAVNSTTIDATPEQVFSVLSDPDAYGHWVVGAADIRDADPGFPAAGTRFHHTQGIPGLGLKDHTEVIEVTPPGRLVLRAKARPLGTARVQLDITPAADGSTVTIDERLVGTMGKIVPKPLTDPLIKRRNAEGMRRLKRLVEERHPR